MSKNKSELQEELSELGKQLGVPVDLNQTNDLLEEDIATLTARLTAQSGDQGNDSKAAEPQPDQPESLTEKVKIVALKTFETRLDNERYKLCKGAKDTVPYDFAALMIKERVAIAFVEDKA